jgi:hypothetical protein
LCGSALRREQLASPIFSEAYRLEKKRDESYRLINERLNVVVYHLDGVPLETIASFLEQPESRANSPGALHR